MGPFLSWYNFARELLNCHCSTESSVDNKILEGMTRRKIRDRENQKSFKGFQYMADFFTGNRDPIPPPPDRLLLGVGLGVVVELW